MYSGLRKTLAGLALLLGSAHIIFGCVVFKAFNLEVFWFLGFGLALILAALANFRQDKIWILRGQNFLMLGFILALLSLTQGPQIWLGCILFTGLFIIPCLKSPALMTKL